MFLTGSLVAIVTHYVKIMNKSCFNVFIKATITLSNDAILSSSSDTVLYYHSLNPLGPQYPHTNSPD